MTTKTHKYYIFTVVGLAIFIFVALGRELFYGLPLDETFAVLSDCSFIAGVLLAGFGGLSFVASRGGYDAFGYAGSLIKSHFVRPSGYKPESFYDYKERKAAERKPWLRESLFDGIGFIAASAVFLVIYLLITR